MICNCRANERSFAGGGRLVAWTLLVGLTGALLPTLAACGGKNDHCDVGSNTGLREVRSISLDSLQGTSMRPRSLDVSGDRLHVLAANCWAEDDCDFQIQNVDLESGATTGEQSIDVPDDWGESAELHRLARRNDRFVLSGPCPESDDGTGFYAFDPSEDAFEHLFCRERRPRDSGLDVRDAEDTLISLEDRRPVELALSDGEVVARHSIEYGAPTAGLAVAGDRIWFANRAFEHPMTNKIVGGNLSSDAPDQTFGIECSREFRGVEIWGIAARDDRVWVGGYDLERDVRVVTEFEYEGS